MATYSFIKIQNVTVLTALFDYINHMPWLQSCVDGNGSLASKQYIHMIKNYIIRDRSVGAVETYIIPLFQFCMKHSIVKNCLVNAVSYILYSIYSFVTDKSCTCKLLTISLN